MEIFTKKLLVGYILVLVSCTDKFSIPNTVVIPNSINLIASDMSECHVAIPRGVPAYFNWRVCPRVGAGNEPGSKKAMIPWGQVYVVEGESAIPEVAVQIRNLKTYYLSKKSKKWMLWTSSERVEGSYYAEDFENDRNIEAKEVIESSGGISISMVDGYNYHFWTTNGRVDIDPVDIEGVWSTVEARIVLPVNSKGLSPKYLMSVGADYWLNKTAEWKADWSSNGDIGIGRFRFLSTAWQSYNMHTLTDSTLKAIPPPY